MITTTKFNTGSTVMTRGIADAIGESEKLAKFVLACYGRYLHGDWGDLDPEDAHLNDLAVESGEDRIFASYNMPEGMEYDCGGYGTDVKVWIITEWDRSATTILFPSEY